MSLTTDSRSSLLWCVVFLVGMIGTTSCERKPSTKAPVTDARATTEASTDKPADVAEDAGEEKTDAFTWGELEGDPVAVSKPRVLHEADGLRLEEQRWELDGRRGLAWRVRVERELDVEVVPSERVVDFAELLPSGPGPWAAINGGFYEAIPEASDAGPRYRAMGLVVTDGRIVSSKTRRGGSGVFLFDEEGPRVVHRNDWQSGAREALQSIDRIIADGESLMTRRDRADNDPRSAIGVSDDYVWMVVATSEDGCTKRPEGYAMHQTLGTGMPLWAFAEYVLQTTESRDVLNLDGGVSSQLAVRDGEFDFRVHGIRGTINAIVVRPGGF